MTTRRRGGLDELTERESMNRTHYLLLANTNNVQHNLTYIYLPLRDIIAFELISQVSNTYAS